MKFKTLKQSLFSVHTICTLFLIIVATSYLHDVLFQDKHLSSFDFILNKPAWEKEFGNQKINNAFLSDSVTAHYPYRKIFWESLQNFSNVDYLPHILAGQPTNGQGIGIFSTSIFQLFMDIPNAVDWSTWLRLILAGVFIYILMIYLKCSPIIASFVAIAWTYSSHQMVWLLFPQHLATQLWIPLIFYLNLRILNDKLCWSTIMGLVISIIFFYSSGYTQIVLYSFILIGMFNTVFCITTKDSAANIIKKWIRIHIVYIVAAVLLLPDAMSQMSEIANGLRGSQDFRYQNFDTGSFALLISDFFPRPIEIVRFLSPNYLGGIMKAPGLRDIFPTNDVEFRAYFGFIGVFFAIYGISAGIKRKNNFTISATICLALLFAIFNKNPLMLGIINLIPFGGAGGFDRYITLILFLSIVLSGFGLRFFFDDRKNKNIFWSFFSLFIIIAWIFIAKIKHDSLINLWAFLPSLVILTTFIILSQFFRKHKNENIIAIFVLLFTTYELLTSTFNFNTRLPSEHHFPTNSVIEHIQSTPGNFRTALVMNNTSYHHNILSYFKLATIGGYATTAPNDYIKFLQHTYGDVAVTLNGIVFLMNHNPKLLRLLNTRFIVSNIPLEDKSVTKIYSNNANTLYELKHPLGRVYCASNQLVSKEVETSVDEFLKAIDIYDRPVMVEKSMINQGTLTNNCLIHNINVYQNKLDFTVETDQPTLIFAPISFHKNWTAKISGADIRILKANFAFMALEIPAGKHDLVLQYRNKELVISAIFMIAFAIFLLIFTLKTNGPIWRKSVFLVCSLLIIYKSIFWLPGVRNDEITERSITLQILNKSIEQKNNSEIKRAN